MVRPGFVHVMNARMVNHPFIHFKRFANDDVGTLTVVEWTAQKAMTRPDVTETWQDACMSTDEGQASFRHRFLAAPRGQEAGFRGLLEAWKACLNVVGPGSLFHVQRCLQERSSDAPKGEALERRAPRAAAGPETAAKVARARVAWAGPLAMADRRAMAAVVALAETRAREDRVAVRSPNWAYAC